MCNLWLCARLDVGPDALRSPHAAAPELAAQPVVARERAVQVSVRALNRARKAKRIESRLRHPHADMRARYERGVPEQDHPPRPHARRFEIENCLEERL